MHDMVIEGIVRALITAVIGALFAATIAWVKKLDSENKNTKIGMRSLLRDQIIRTYDKWSDCGYCPVHVREATQEAYDSYHALGGNGVITALWEKLQQLPTEKPEGEQK